MTAASDAGGGSGGSFGSSGSGGVPTTAAIPGVVPSRPVIPTALRGGCSGEAGLDGGDGAVALLAVTSIQLDGVINASGGGWGVVR